MRNPIPVVPVLSVSTPDLDSLQILQRALETQRLVYDGCALEAGRSGVRELRGGHVDESGRHERRAIEYRRRIDLIDAMLAQFPHPEPLLAPMGEQA